MDVNGIPPAAPATIFKLKMTSQLATKIVANATLMLLGFYYLAMGKKEQDFRRMVIGCGLVIGALLLF